MAKQPRYRFTFTVWKRYTTFSTRDTILTVSTIAENEEDAKRKALKASGERAYGYEFNAELKKIEEI